MLFVLASGFKAVMWIGGLSISSSVVEKLLENYGQDRFIPILKIAGYVVCAYIALDFCVDTIKLTGRKFGVRL